MRLLRGGRRTGPEALQAATLTGRLVNTSSPEYRGCGLPLHRGQHGRQGRPAAPAAVRDRGASRRAGGLHRRHDPLHADLPARPPRGALSLHGHLRGREPLGARAAPPGRRGDRGPRPRRRTDAGRVGRARLRRRDHRGGARDELGRGRGRGRSQPLAGFTCACRTPDGSGDKLIVEALSYGVAYDEVDILVDRRTGEVVSKSAEIPDTGHAGVEADAGMAALVERYRQRVAPLANHVVGTTRAPLTRGGGELGQLVANAEQAFARADVAVVKPVSLRADIDAGPVTFAELSEVLAFDHPVVRVRLSGRELRELIGDGEAYVAGPEELDPRAELQRGGERADRRRRPRGRHRAAGARLVPGSLSGRYCGPCRSRSTRTWPSSARASSAARSRASCRASTCA